MKVAIYGRPTSNNTTEPVEELFHKLNQYKAEIVIFEPFYKFLKQKIHISGAIKMFKSHEDLDNSVDVMLSIGGDGTFLATLNYVRDSGIPVLGINTGHLGFLANVAQEEVKLAIDALINKKFKIEERALIKVTTDKKTLFGDINYGLNELAIFKKDSHSMITVHTYINGEFLNSYFADGLIVATPTGSTAYSLSCGGPLVMPGSHNFVITPIAPHNINVRPLVISDDKEITLKVEGRSKQYLATLDSRNEVIDSTTQLTVKRAKFNLNIIKLENQNFFTTIRNKLLWGIDRRK